MLKINWLVLPENLISEVQKLPNTEQMPRWKCLEFNFMVSENFVVKKFAIGQWRILGIDILCMQQGDRLAVNEEEFYSIIDFHTLLRSTNENTQISNFKTAIG